MLACICATALPAAANKRRAPTGGQRAVVVDERLAALRADPSLTAPLVQRLGRGRAVAIVGGRRAGDGVDFYHVAVTRRTRGWLQSDSVVAPARTREDERLLRLIEASADFERIARARIFLDEFPRSALRPAVLLLYGAAAEEAALKLSRDAARRLAEEKLPVAGPPAHSYYLNYNGLDRYRRQGITFTFEQPTKQFRYDGASWRELLRRYPRSPEAGEARRRLATRAGVAAR
ncbi:MAG TPA: hypothetical protein VF525_03475 [Pyrinomonadaceae bacterium]